MLIALVILIVGYDNILALCFLCLLIFSKNNDVYNFLNSVNLSLLIKLIMFQRKYLFTCSAINWICNFAN